MTKPALFIASSVEGLQVADSINENLDHDVHCTLWRTGTFKLSSQTIDDLVKKSSTVDFAVFVFTPDDLTTIREKQHATARDNVIFELGLFIGAIGKERCYVVKPRDPRRPTSQATVPRLQASNPLSRMRSTRPCSSRAYSPWAARQTSDLLCSASSALCTFGVSTLTVLSASSRANCSV